MLLLPLWLNIILGLIKCLTIGDYFSNIGVRYKITIKNNVADN